MLAIINVAVTVVFMGLFVLLSLWRGHGASFIEHVCAYVFLAAVTYLIDRWWVGRRREERRVEPGRGPAPWNYWVMTLFYPFILLSSGTRLASFALGATWDEGPVYTDVILVVCATYLIIYSALTIEKGLKSPGRSARHT